MKLISTLITAFLAASVSGFNPPASTICWKDGGKLIPTGHCVAYDKDGQQTGESYVCRKAFPCKDNRNGCYLKAEFIEGGWYSNCSGG